MAGRFEAHLIETVEKLQSDGVEQTRSGLKSRGVVFAENGLDLALVVFPEKGTSTAAIKSALERQGAALIRQDEHTIKIAIPLPKLTGLSSVEGISYVRTIRPPRESNTIMTQGRVAALASNWQSGGSMGAGAKIAVVDYGFLGYATLQTQGELPVSLTTVNYGATALDSGSSHGSACAEIAHDMAPGADLVLIKIDDPSDILTVADYCAANGVDVVSCSVGGWDGMGFHDGIAQKNWFSTLETHPITAVNQATANGILWVNAAGNSQREHSLIDWRDANSNGLLDWTSTQTSLNALWLDGSSNIPAGVRLDIVLTWNQWATTNQDFDLLLFKNTGSGWAQVTTGFTGGWTGSDTQSGSNTSYPFENIIFQTTDASAQYAVAINKYSATTSPTFMLRYNGVDEPIYFGYDNTSTPAPGSIVIPGDAASSFTVGALDWSTYTTGTIELYSSLGPNNRAYTGGTALLKPDICGPVWVDTVSRGAGAFGGTSAATPHIAGLAALARAAYPAMTVAETRSFLEAKALDRGTTGKDNTYGAGAARVTSEAPPVVTAIDRSGPTPTSPGTVQFAVTFNKSVNGGSSANFELVTTGLSGASITSVTGSSSTRTVTVNTGTGTGSVSLNMINSSGVTDAVGNAVAALPFTGQAYSISLPEVTLAVSPSSMAEDAAGTMAYTFTRTGGTTSALTVNFSVSGTAVLATDYSQSGSATFTASAGTVTFAAGSATAVVSIDPTLDTAVEVNETVILTVTTGSGYAVGSPNAATGTITNDDTDTSLTLSPTFQNEDTSGTLDFTFTRSGVTSGPLTMNFSVGGTATFGTDYTVSGAATFTASSGTVVFGAGVTTVVVSVDPTSDLSLEPDENVLLTITPGSGYNVGGSSSASATIFNDEASISVSVSPSSLNEDAAGTMAYTFTRAGYGGTPLTVGFNVGGTAAFGTDYSQTGAATFAASSGTVQFGLGTTSVTVNIDPASDTTPESDETVILSVASSISYLIGSPSSATGTILNDDAAAVSVAVSPSSMAEDAVGTMAYTFTRTGPTTSAMTINFNVGGTAAFSTDYTQSGAATYAASSGTVTFAAGAATAVVNLDPTADTTVEGDETAVLTVTSGAGYTVGSPSAATGTISNDDTTVTVVVAPSSMNEDAAGILAYTFTRSGVTAGVLTANFSVGGTATFSADYTQSGAAMFGATSGTVTFAAGATTASVTIDPTTDSTVENDETVTLTVAAGSGYTAGGSPATTTILNDDASVSVVFSPASMSEDAVGTMPCTFTRAGVSAGTLTVNFSVGGTATFSTDYVQSGAATFGASAGTITFAAGSATAVVNIDPAADSLFETNETVLINVVSGFGYSVGTPSSTTGTINNDDGTPTIQWSATSSSVAESAASIVITATLSAVSAQDAMVHVTRSGSAIDLTDYEVAGQPLEVLITIPAGQTSSSMTVNVLNDALDETDETVVLTMDSFPIQNAILGSPVVHTLTIIDDENPEIAVEQPVGTNLVDGTASIPFGSSALGTSIVRTFTVRNPGTAVLSGLAINKDGANSNDFVVGSLGSTSVAGGGNTTFDVTFTPSATGARAAAIHISSNDADENPFDITLTGTGLSAAGVTIAESGGSTSVAELGAADSYTMVLNTAPTSAVTITLNPGSQLTANPASLVFTTANWNVPQMVTVSTVNDLISEGTHTGTITHSAASSDTGYNGLSIASVQATISDNDVALAKNELISIPSSGTATPYPSVLAVSGITSVVTNVRVSLNGFSHTWPDDVDVLLVSPSGQVVALMSDVGGGTDAAGVNLVFDDNAASVLGDENAISSGTFKPTNYDTAETLPPGVSGVISLSLASLIPGGVNGDWKLYVTDDTASDGGSIQSWSLQFETSTVPEIAIDHSGGTPLADGTGSMVFGSVNVGSSGLARTFTIRNAGGATLSGLAVTKDGTHAGDFGLDTTGMSTTLAPGASTTFSVVFAPGATGLRTAAIHCASNDGDENPFDIAIAGTGGPAGSLLSFIDATTVIGQTNFTNQSSTASQIVTPGPSGSAVSVTGKLALCEQTTGRVLIWNSVPTSNGQPADVVVGKPDFTSTTAGVTAALTGSCDGVAFSPDGQKLIVSDSSNHRVLIWNSVPTVNGTPADVVIGQSDFTSNASGLSQTKFNYPAGLVVTPSGQLLVSESSNNRVLVFNTMPSANGAAADVVIGQTGFTTNTTGSSASQLSGPWGLGLTADGKLLVADSGNHRVLVFNSVPAVSGASASLVLGQSGFGTNVAGTSASLMSSPIGLSVSPSGALAVAEFGNNRVLIFNSFPAVSGASADLVLGQPDFTTGTSFSNGIHASSLSRPYPPSFTPEGRLVVPGRNMKRALIFGSPAQEIVVEQPVGTSLTDGTASIAFGSVNLGSMSSALTFTIRNVGTANLTGLAVSKDGANATDFTVGSLAVTTLASGASTTFTVTFTPGALGVRTAAIHLASNDADESPFDITLTGAGTTPEIVVEQPVGTSLTDGTASIAFGSINLGGSAPPLTFTIRNTGTANLTGLAVSKDGIGSTNFIIGSLGAVSLQPGASTTFTVTFAPVGGSSGTRTAAIHIASNDADENPFDIALSGMALSNTADIDNDGMNDWGEYQLAAMGFDWQVNNSTLVSSYFAAANSNGLYTASQVQSLHVGAPLLQRNPGTGAFTLTIGIDKSTTLQPGSFVPFPFSSPQTTINGQGKIEFQFTVPDNAAFFQLQAQ